MKEKWTRRKFLQTGLKGSMVVGGRAVAAGSYATAATPAISKATSAGLDRRQREVLRAAMDEIIPASDGMPAASEVGGVGYLDRLAGENRGIKKDLEKSLAGLDEIGQKLFGRGYASLSQAERVEALRRLEKQPALEPFATLRDFTYEAYYTQPSIWKLIGYEFHPTNQSGPRMKPFDEAILASVRKKPKFFREG
jgi:gluconate 2-dehydrogenase subunit 3-like protein